MANEHNRYNSRNCENLLFFLTISKLKKISITKPNKLENV